MLKLEKPLKQTERTFESITAPVEYAKPVYDENGNQIGEEYYRPVFNANSEVVGEEKIDKEAERKAQEEKEQKRQQAQSADVEEEFVFEAGDVVGEDDEEAEAEEEAARALAEERKAFKEKAMMISENASLTDEQKRAGLAALLASNVTETTETFQPVTTTTTFM